MKTIYTKAALEAIVAFQENQQALLEEVIAERKAVLGDEVLEITASDVKAASRRIRLVAPATRRFQSTALITRTYVFLGLVMMVGAFFYPQIQLIFQQNKTQALVFILGATVSLVGIVGGYWLKLRERQFLDRTRELHFLESEELSRKMGDRARLDD